MPLHLLLKSSNRCRVVRVIVAHAESFPEVDAVLLLQCPSHWQMPAVSLLATRRVSRHSKHKLARERSKYEVCEPGTREHTSKVQWYSTSKTLRDRKLQDHSPA